MVGWGQIEVSNAWNESKASRGWIKYIIRRLTYPNYELFNHMTSLRNNPKYILQAYSLFNKNAHKVFLYHK